jgi:hypothetical protein
MLLIGYSGDENCLEKCEAIRHLKKGYLCTILSSIILVCSFMQF